ncbi:chaperonin 10-like protein [Mycena olivaceomarginata]|nr:chaperonin 10-like protein [Mycena olivaceomarginata]
MNAVYYHGVENFEILSQAPVAEIEDNQVQIKVSCCGICGTDSHIAKGEFIAKFPLIPGHEIVGTISKIGKSVTGFSIGDRCVADPGVTCENCFYCRRGQSLLCENFGSLGVTMSGGFADYVTVACKKVYKIVNLTDEEATLVEPACLRCLILAQLLKLNGASKVVIAANKGVKTEIARTLDAADEYVELDRDAPDAQWAQLKRTIRTDSMPFVLQTNHWRQIEATGSEKVANASINYVRRGGTLMVYGVYANEALVHWPPAKIFGDEIRSHSFPLCFAFSHNLTLSAHQIIGSFAQVFCFPRAVAYLDSGKVRVKGMVTDVFSVQDYQKALDKLESKTALKIVVRPGTGA